MGEWFSIEFVEKKKLLNELNKGEEEINNKINNILKIESNYKKYGLLNYEWFEYFKLYLNNSSSIGEREIQILIDIQNLLPKLDKKDYSFINGNYKFNFPSNFVIVTEKFMQLLSSYFNNALNLIEYFKIKNYLFEMKFGNKCLLMKDQNEKNPFRYITLFEDNKQKISNNIDYILIINDKKKLEEEVNFILKKNVWNYMEKISFGFDEFTEIYEQQAKLIGHFMRNGDLKRINILKKLEKENINKTTINRHNNNIKKFQQNNNNFNNKAIIFIFLKYLKY